MKKIIELAPAKLNLYLKVIRKRPDGYHDIETLFERIDIFDRITLASKKEGIEIRCSNPSVPTGKGSLCYRAAELLKNRFKIKSGVAIKIKKNIPVASGLGGGSSDAASILKGLSRLWDLKLTRPRLMKLSIELGADVPFFLSGSSFAIGQARGDKIEPIKSRKKYWHLIISPDIMLFSGEIYKLYSETHSLDADAHKSNADIQRYLGISACNLRLSALNLYNDLEPIVLSREPLIRNIKDLLGKGKNENALVSGSGPSVFSLYETRKEALEAKKNCLRRVSNRRRLRTFVAKTC